MGTILAGSPESPDLTDMQAGPATGDQTADYTFSVNYTDLDNHPPVYVNVSLYMSQIHRYLRFFKRDAFHFLLLEDLQEAPVQVLQGVQSFLGLDIQNLVGKDAELRANVGGAGHYLWFEMMSVIEAHPILLNVKRLIPESIRKLMFSGLKRSPIGQRVMDSYQLPPMKKETRQRLLDVFQKPNEELASFLSRDLSIWFLGEL